MSRRRANRALALFTVACWLTSGCSQDVRLFARDGEPKDGGTRDAGGRVDAGSDAQAGDDAGRTDAGSPPVERPHALAVGSVHACAIRAGRLFCWGDGLNGKLGLGDDVSRNVPSQIDDAADWMSVCASEEHTCALKADKSVHCWGQNTHGQLGLGDFVSRDRPTALQGLSLVRLFCGGYNTCGLSSDEALYCWGDNYEGKLGQGDPFDSEDITVPTRVAPTTRMRDVSVGQGHVCAIGREGTLSCWGRNSDGQLGIDDPEVQVRTPTAVAGQRTYRRVAAGQRHTCAIDVEGQLWCWGTDSEGSLGVGVADGTLTASPQRVGEARGWLDLDVDWFHSCAIRMPNELYCWGRNIEGQLGLSDVSPRNVPARVSLQDDWDEVAVGRFFSCGLRATDLYCWGENEQGQLGTGDMARRDVPTRVTLP